MSAENSAADPSQAQPLADLVEELGPGLLTAASGSHPESEVARTLVEIWRSGPPYAAAAEQARARLSCDRTSDHPSDPSDVEVDAGRLAAVHRLAQTYRAGTRRRRRTGTVGAVAALLVLVALAVVIIPRLGAPTTSTPVQTTTTSSAASTPAPTKPTPAPTKPTPTAPSTTQQYEPDCRAQECLPDDAGGWRNGVLEAAYERLDPDDEFATDDIIAATRLGSDRDGELLTVVVVGPSTATTAVVWTTTDDTRVPDCGATVRATCEETTTDGGEQVSLARSERVIEARYTSGSVVVQVMISRDGPPLQVTTAEALSFVTDERLRLPS